MSDVRLFSGSSKQSEDREDLEDLLAEKKIEISVCKDQLRLLGYLIKRELRPHQLKLFFLDDSSFRLGIPIEKISQDELIKLLDKAVAADEKVLNMKREYESAVSYLRMNTQQPQPKLPAEYKALKNQASVLITAIYCLINFDKITEVITATHNEMEQHKADLTSLLLKQVKSEVRPGACFTR